MKKKNIVEVKKGDTIKAGWTIQEVYNILRNADGTLKEIQTYDSVGLPRRITTSFEQWEICEK